MAEINLALEASFGQIHRLMAGERSLEVKTAIMDEIYGLNDRFLEIVRPALDGVSLQCARGCAHCCEFRVEALPVEALRIARYLRGQHEAILAELRPRLQAQADYAQGRSEKRYQRKCAFMDEQGACRIYEVRPFKCRVHHSLDRHSCGNGRRAFTVGLLEQLEEMMIQGIAGLFRERGLSVVPAELGGAVLRALESPALEDQWLRGGQPFASRSLPMPPLESGHPWSRSVL